MSEFVKEKRTYFDCLRNIDNWLKLLIISNNVLTIDDDHIEETCSYMIDNLNRTFTGMTPERRATVMITTLNNLIRIYVFDKYNVITSHAQFRRAIRTFIEQIMIEISSDGPSSYCEYAAGMIDLFLINLAKDNFIVKCLEKFWPNKLVSATESLTDDDQRRTTVIDDARKFTLAMFAFTGKLSFEADIQLVEEFNTNYQSVMSSALEFVDDIFTNYDNYDVSRSYTDIIYYILSFAWNLADKTPLVPMFVQAKYPDITVKWLDKLSFLRIDKNLFIPIVNIVYNISRHKKGLKALQALKTFQILMERKSFINEMNDTDLNESFSMLLIALSTSAEEQKQIEDLILTSSENLLSNAKKAFKQENWRWEGCHLSEYLYSLQGAFSNTSIVQQILGKPPNVKKEKIGFFAHLLYSVYGLLFNQDTDDLEKVVVKSLLDIILCISNYKEYRKELYSNANLSILIEALAKQSGQDIAKRIWSNLQQQPEDEKSSPDKPKKEKTASIYISYNWTDQKFCESFIEVLRDKLTNLPIWVDYEQTSGMQDPWECLAPVIESATIIIVLASDAYNQSRSNRQELTYAMLNIFSSDEEKSVIIVGAAPNLKFNQDWMSFLLQDRKIIPYCDITTDLVNDVIKDSVLSKYRKHPSVLVSSNNVTQSQLCTIM